MAERTPGPVARVVAGGALLLWAGVLVLAVLKAPRGFDFGWRFYLHDVLPWLALVISVGGLAGSRRPAVPRGALELLGALALGAAAGCAQRFPESEMALPIAFGALAAPTLLASGVLWRARLPWAAHFGLFVLGLLLGLGVPEALRAPDPSTRPQGEPIALPRPPPHDDVQLAPDGVLRLESPGLRVALDPFFTIESRSPDRGWTVLAPSSTRHQTFWVRDGAAQEGATSHTYWLSNDGEGVVSAREGAIDTSFTLDAPVFTHLATWTQLRVLAPGAVVRVSPCGETDIEVRPSDYPEGRPARFAYLSADERLVVAEATSGEKGPFTTLCEGSLPRGEPLSITVRHESGAVRFTLLDFSAQASTEPSPTAGWGVPQNAIQLMREGNRADGAIVVHIALAATGIGRGWDTVGLAPGTYRNRIRYSLE